MKIVPIIRQDTQTPMLVLLLTISCYIIAFRSNKDDVQNISRMRDGMCKYSAYDAFVSDRKFQQCRLQHFAI